MDVEQVLYMNGGGAELSYANNSSPQKSFILKTKPLIEETIANLFSQTKLEKFSIADLGCSSGPNTLSAITLVLDAVHAHVNGNLYPEIQIFLNDLPGNDFNAVFKTFPSFKEKLLNRVGDELIPCCISATPGSFYGRLFLSESMHFIYSSASLHWLSQVPPMLAGKINDVNKGNVALGPTSPPIVHDEYLNQFRGDFTIFLKARSKEMVFGGCMVLSLLGRPSLDPFGQECDLDWSDLALALRELVSEGVIEEEKLDSFNMPFYAPYIGELKEIIEAEGSFDIVQLKARERDERESQGNNQMSEVDCKTAAKVSRAITESMLTSHFGEAVIDKLFEKVEEVMAKSEYPKTAFLMVSLIRK